MLIAPRTVSFTKVKQTQRDYFLLNLPYSVPERKKNVPIAIFVMIFLVFSFIFARYQTNFEDDFEMF